MDENKLEDYSDRQDITIEGNVATWEIRLEGDIQGTYSGAFKFRCFLTPTQRLAAGREHRELLGNQPSLATMHDYNLAFSLSQLKYRVISGPPFWASTVQLSGVSGDVPDENVIDAVLEAAVASELKYKAQLKKKKADAIERAKKAAESLLKLRDEHNEGKNKEDDDQS